MTMKERLRSRVAELTSIIGVSGHEWDVAKYIFDAIKDDVDTIEQLLNGIIVATKKGAHPGPRVMVSAHMDEVGIARHFARPQKATAAKLDLVVTRAAACKIARHAHGQAHRLHARFVEHQKQRGIAAASKLGFNCGNVTPAIGIVNHKQVDTQAVARRKRLRRRHFQRTHVGIHRRE